MNYWRGFSIIYCTLMVATMDQVEAKRNRERYEQNIKGASMIHSMDMPQHLIDGLAHFIRDQRRKIHNIETNLNGD